MYIDADGLILAGDDVLQSFVLCTAGDLQHIDSRSLKLRSQVHHIFQRIAADLALIARDA